MYPAQLLDKKRKALDKVAGRREVGRKQREKNPTMETRAEGGGGQEKEGENNNSTGFTTKRWFDIPFCRYKK